MSVSDTQASHPVGTCLKLSAFILEPVRVGHRISSLPYACSRVDDWTVIRAAEKVPRKRRVTMARDEREAVASDERIPRLVTCVLLSFACRTRYPRLRAVVQRKETDMLGVAWRGALRAFYICRVRRRPTF